MDTVRVRAKMRDEEQKLELLKWIAGYIAEDNVAASWVPGKLDIKKSTLYFSGRFWWSVVRYRLGPTNADNSLILDRAVVVASILAGYEIHFARYISGDLRVGFQRSHEYTFPMPDPGAV